MNDLCVRSMMPIVAAVEELENAAAEAGLSSDDLIRLLQDGLDVDHVLSYVAAVVTNRLN